MLDFFRHFLGQIGRLAQVLAQIVQLASVAVDSDRIFVVEYPNPTEDSDGSYCDGEPSGDALSRIDENEARDPQSRLAGVFDFMQRKMIAVKTVTRAYMQDEDKLRGPLAELFGPISFEDLEIPLATVSLDLISGQGKVFTSGPVIDGIYASSAIPSVFPPRLSEMKWPS